MGIKKNFTHDELDAEITKIFRKYRDARNLSQRDIADHMGVSLGTVRNLEGGTTKWNTKHLAAASAIVGIPVHELIPRLEEQAPPTPLRLAADAGNLGEVLRAVADEVDRQRAEDAADGDPQLATLIEAHGRHDWDSMMAVLMQLRLDWGIDPPRKPKGRRG